MAMEDVKVRGKADEILLRNCNAEVMVLLISTWFTSVNTQKPSYTLSTLCY